MTKPTQKRKRRGVILSHWGLQRLREAQEALALTTIGGQNYTLERLSNLTGLSVRSITRLQSCKVAVDRQTLEEFFCTFNLTLTADDYIQPEVKATDTQKSANPIQQDWGEALDVSVFYGRTEELTTLKQWILRDGCRLVGILGIGGIGKTALSLKLAEQIQDQFAYVIWRSLRNAPPMETLLAELVPFLSGQQETQADLSSFLQCLRNHRCLVVLDNMETLLGTGNQAGEYRLGYESYGELLRVVAETRHQSCVVLTTREECAQSAQLKGNPVVQGLSLSGSPEASRALLEAMGLTGTENQQQTLCERYCCNPLALKIVATTIRDLFGGKIALFLEQNVTLFGDISDLIQRHYDRLSALEKQVMLWLAIDREWVSFAELQADLQGSVLPMQLMEALQLLQGRSLMETNAGQFTLQPVIMEYATETLIDRVCDEIVDHSSSIPLPPTALLQTHALIKAQDKDYIRDSQIRVILMPLSTRLLSRLGSRKETVYQLNQILHYLQTESPNQAGYASGNLINLLRYLQVDLSGYDFSYLSIWQADLQNVDLHRVNFAHSDLSKSRFIQSFGSVLAVAFSPDGRLSATGDDRGRICLWSVADGQLFSSYQAHDNWVRSITFSPDGRLLASGSDDTTVILWNLQTNQVVHTLETETAWVSSITFSPDGRLLLSMDDRMLQLWDVQTGQLCHLPQNAGWIQSAAFSSDGSLLAISSDDQTVKLWDASNGRVLRDLQPHTNCIQAVVLSPNGTLLAGVDHHQVVIWDIKSGQVVHTLRAHTDQINSIAFCSTGETLVSGSKDQSLKLWNVQTGQCLKTVRKHTDGVNCVAFSPDRCTIASGSSDQSLMLWNGQTGECIRIWQGYSSQVLSIALSSDAQVLASSYSDKTIRLWDIHTGQVLQRLQGHTEWVLCVAMAPSNAKTSSGYKYRILASGSCDRTIKIWCLRTGQVRMTLRGHTGFVRTLSISPDGKTLVSGSSGDRTVRLWDLETGNALLIQTHNSWIRSVVFSPDGTLFATGGGDRYISLWDVQTGKCLRTFQGHDNAIHAIAFSPDGSVMATGSADQTVRLWDVQTGKLLHQLNKHRGWLHSVSFSPDGKMLASGSDDRIIWLWDTTTGEGLRALQGHHHQVRSLEFTPDGQTLLSGSADGTIKLWDINTGECLKTLRADRPYEGMNITAVTGITEAQKVTLKKLGAVDTGLVISESLKAT